MQKIFELDAERGDAELGITALWKGLEVTALDGTTMELARSGALEDAFGTPADGAKPLLRVAAHVRTATSRWIGAAIGGYHDGENALADQLESTFRPGMLNLADRGFFHGPVAAVLHRRRAPGLAGQERRGSRPAQDHPLPAGRV
jgi:hypothetical protein